MVIFILKILLFTFISWVLGVLTSAISFYVDLKTSGVSPFETDIVLQKKDYHYKLNSVFFIIYFIISCFLFIVK